MDTIELLAEISVLRERLKNSVEVVRCKDCKHSTEYSDKQVVCVWFDTLVFQSNFCSNGERREANEIN